MLVKTAMFGEQSVDPDTTLTFPLGLPGFEQCKRSARGERFDQIAFGDQYENAEGLAKAVAGHRAHGDHAGKGHRNRVQGALNGDIHH